MSVSELACTYAALILHDDGMEITADNISSLTKAANVTVEPFWPSLFAKLFSKKSVEDFIGAVGAAPAAGGAAGGAPAAGGGDAAGGGAAEAAKKEESEDEDSGSDIGMSLFD